MKETLSLTQVIAEEKRIKFNIAKFFNSRIDQIDLVTYYPKNRPFVGARTAEEQEKLQKEQFQTLNDYFKRLAALRKAHTKANRETMVMVPVEPTLMDIAQGKELGLEAITIAEAINRKNFYKVSSNGVGLTNFASALVATYTENIQKRAELVKNVDEEINYQLSKRFPPDSKNSWSQEKYTEVKKQLEKESEIITIDPYGLIGSSAIPNFKRYVEDYISQIDTIISQANAYTNVDIEY